MSPSATEHLGTIPSSEIQLVSTAIGYCSGGRHGGVVVWSEGGVRRWQIADDQTHIVVAGDEADFTGAYALSAQFISHSAQLSRMDSEIKIKIAGSRATASARPGNVSMAARCQDPEPSPVDRPLPVVAILPWYHLFRTLDTGSAFPSEGPRPDTETGYPDSTLAVADGRLTCSTRWSALGAEDVSASTDVAAQGAGTIRVHAPRLNLMTNLSPMEHVSEARLAFDPSPGPWLEITMGPITIAIRTSSAPSRIAFEALRTWIESRGITAVDDGSSSLVADEDGTLVRVDVLEHESGDEIVARCSSVALRDARATHDLLREINAHNVATTTSRVWLDGEEVIVGADAFLSPPYDGAFARWYFGVTRDARRLAGVLAPLAAT